MKQESGGRREPNCPFHLTPNSYRIKIRAKILIMHAFIYVIEFLKRQPMKNRALSVKWHQMSGVLKPRRENERERRKRRGTIKLGNQFLSVSIGNSGDRTTKPIRIA